MAVENPRSCQGLWHCGVYCVKGVFWELLLWYSGWNLTSIMGSVFPVWTRHVSAGVSRSPICLSEPSGGFKNFVSCLQSFCLALPQKDSFAMSMLMAPGCKAALALLSCSQIWRSGTLSSVTPGPSPLLAVLPQFLPVQLSQYFLPKHHQKLHNSTNRALQRIKNSRRTLLEWWPPRGSRARAFLQFFHTAAQHRQCER